MIICTYIILCLLSVINSVANEKLPTLNKREIYMLYPVYFYDSQLL